MQKVVFRNVKQTRSQVQQSNFARRGFTLTELLIVMAILMAVLFVGSIGLTQFLGVTASPDETILSALARRLLGNGTAYFVIQVSTMLILAVAANTSFAGFPPPDSHPGKGWIPA